MSLNLDVSKALNVLKLQSTFITSVVHLPHQSLYRTCN